MKGFCLCFYYELFGHRSYAVWFLLKVFYCSFFIVLLDVSEKGGDNILMFCLTHCKKFGDIHLKMYLSYLLQSVQWHSFEGEIYFNAHYLFAIFCFEFTGQWKSPLLSVNRTLNSDIGLTFCRHNCLKAMHKWSQRMKYCILLNIWICMCHIFIHSRSNLKHNIILSGKKIHANNRMHFFALATYLILNICFIWLKICSFLCQPMWFDLKDDMLLQYYLSIFLRLVLTSFLKNIYLSCPHNLMCFDWKFKASSINQCGLFWRIMCFYNSNCLFSETRPYLLLICLHQNIFFFPSQRKVSSLVLCKTLFMSIAPAHPFSLENGLIWDEMIVEQCTFVDLMHLDRMIGPYRSSFYGLFYSFSPFSLSSNNSTPPSFKQLLFVPLVVTILHDIELKPSLDESCKVLLWFGLSSRK